MEEILDNLGRLAGQRTGTDQIIKEGTRYRSESTRLNSSHHEQSRMPSSA